MLARFDDGAVAAAERKVGPGRVIVWTSTLDDSWSDLPRKPVYLPLVHQLVKYLAQYEEPRSWQTVGQVVDVSALTKARANWVVVTPSGERVTSTGPLELDEQGVYEVRPAGGRGDGAAAGDRRQHRPGRVRPDADRPGRARRGRHRPRGARPRRRSRPAETDRVRRQRCREAAGLWWYLLLAGLLLLAAETVVSNRLSQGERFL